MGCVWWRPHLVDIGALQSQKLLPSDAHWAAMIIGGPLQPDDVIAIAASYDATGATEPRLRSAIS